MPYRGFGVCKPLPARQRQRQATVTSWLPRLPWPACRCMHTPGMPWGAHSSAELQAAALCLLTPASMLPPPALTPAPLPPPPAPQAAVKALQGSSLDGHKLVLQLSQKKPAGG